MFDATADQLTLNSDAYISLLNGLPRHAGLQETRQPPISRYRLDRRLKQLTRADAQLLADIEQVLQWRHVGEQLASHEVANIEIVKRQQALLSQLQQLTSGPRQMRWWPLYQLVMERLDIRTLVAALWYRHYQSDSTDGNDLPDEVWSTSRHRQRIQHGWNDATFGLERSYPWLTDVLGDIEHERPFQLEQRLLKIIWQRLSRFEQAGDYSFLAVVIYVLKWDLADRWTRYQGDVAQQRFQTLIDKGLMSVPEFSAGEAP